MMLSLVTVPKLATSRASGAATSFVTDGAAAATLSSAGAL